MDEMALQRNRLWAKGVIDHLKRRNMTGYFAETREEANTIALSLIDKNARIALGGCKTAAEIGLLSALKEGSYQMLQGNSENPRDAMLAAFDADVYLSSVNAMTQDGILVNIDGNANRVAALCYGPKKVVFLVGMNKICADLDSAMKRARNVAAPINAQRFHLSTPCAKTGRCADCLSPDTICCQFLITRFSRHADRIHVILINDSLGF